MAEASGFTLPCEFAEFKETLQHARVVDDSIIYKLNNSVPTKSFATHVNANERCKELYDMLQLTYNGRQVAISNCVLIAKKKVTDLQEERHKDRDNTTLSKKLRKAQTDLRLMENESTVEEVIRERSLKVFKERCWQYYRPPNL